MLYKSRHKHQAKKVYNPANGQLLPIITDDYIDIEFGTGAMKCTPAHDPNDYNLGQKYNLEMIVCMNDDATMNEVAGKYNGLDRYECRKQLVKEIEEKGLVDHIEDITHQVGHSESGNATVSAGIPVSACALTSVCSLVSASDTKDNPPHASDTIASARTNATKAFAYLFIFTFIFFFSFLECLSPYEISNFFSL